MEKSSQVSLIIPCFNEEENVDQLVLQLNGFCNQHREIQLEVIFVDDCSSDGTFAKVLQANHMHYSTRVIRLSKNCGSHAAFRAGCSIAKFDVVTQTSCDLQHPLILISDMLQSMDSNNADTVIAIRANDYYESNFERMFSKFYTWLVRKYAVETYPHGGFDVFMISKRVKSLLNSNVEDNSSFPLQILSYGLVQNKINYQKAQRFKGKSKWTLSKKIKLFIDTFIAFSYAPLRLVTLMGITMLFIGVVWSTYLILRKLFVGDLALGWPMLYSTIILGFGITNISLGIIAEYLWRTLDTARRRPVFVIERDVTI
jgi:dolichol-phosphate mannosyltransferase